MTFQSILLCDWLNKNRSEPSQCCLHQGKGKQPLTPASASEVLQEVAKNRAAPYNTSVLPLTHSQLSHPIGFAVSLSRACLTPQRHRAALPAVDSLRSFEVQAAPSHPGVSGHFPCPLYVCFSHKREVGRAPTDGLTLRRH